MRAICSAIVVAFLLIVGLVGLECSVLSLTLLFIHVLLIINLDSYSNILVKGV